MKLARLKTWFLAVRPWSFSMTFISVSIGTFWVAETAIHWGLYGLTLLALVALHGATNLINDYFDVSNNVDVPGAPTVLYRPHPLAFHKLKLKHVLRLALSLYGVGAIAGMALMIMRGWPLLIIALAGLAISVLYTAKPVALKYRALGEVAVFLAWGPLMVSGAYYVQVQQFSVPLLLVSTPFGILVALVLLANNIRDIRYDAEQHIVTLPVFLGLHAAQTLYVTLVGCAFLAILLMSVAGPLRLGALLVFLSLPLAVPLCRMMYQDIPNDADARTAKLDTAFGILLILSILISRTW